MFKKEVLERFIRYAVVDTMSDETIADKMHPSTEGQWNLLKLLEKELKELGVKDVVLDDKGYLLAHIPSNVEKAKCVAFSAHVDTSSDFQGNGVKPQVIEKYNGKDIKINSKYTIVASENPELKQYIGSSIVTADGSSLLGADDKAGIAEIMTAVSYVIKNPEVKHGEIELLFSPDEETGFGMDFFDVSRLHCEALYTVDGGNRYEIENECFCAATVKVKCTGVSYHLGFARGRMVNAVTMASAYANSLPQVESPEATDGRYGYYCAHDISGSTDETNIVLYLRDFEYSKLEYRIKALEELGKAIEVLYKGGTVKVESQISYMNMREASDAKPKAMEAVFEAGKILGQPLRTEIIRGGTDGARIAQSGIPCPNIYTGAHNMHGPYEWLSVDAMNDCTSLLVETIKQWAK